MVKQRTGIIFPFGENEISRPSAVYTLPGREKTPLSAVRLPPGVTSCAIHDVYYFDRLQVWIRELL